MDKGGAIETMKCPNCKDTSLVLSERKGIEIDYCPDCRGVWLDRGELDKLLDRSREENLVYRGDGEYKPSHSQAYPQHPYKRKKSFLEDLFD